MKYDNNYHSVYKINYHIVFFKYFLLSDNSTICFPVFNFKISKVLAFNNIQQEVPYFYKQGMNCFFIFLKIFQKCDIIKSVKEDKKIKKDLEIL